MQEKYADILLNTCLRVEKDKPLFISFNIERIDFVRIVVSLAYKIGIKDIYLDVVDPYIKHDALINLNIDELKNHPYFNKSIWNEYAKKDAAFLMLASETPGLNEDIDSKKLNDIMTYSHETRKIFDELRSEGKVSWCIAAVPTYLWAKQIFKDSLDPVNDLWNKIFEICMINTFNPSKLIEDKLNRLENNAKLLNEYQFEYLKYSNKLGTDLTIYLPKDHIWETGYSTLKSGKKVLVNFPTEEIFTSPDRLKIDGIVYSSKPLCYQDNIIDNFSLTFKDGKVIDIKADIGLDILKDLITSTKNMDYLGEVSLVENDSTINKTNLIYYETLFDENAACHLALGDSFNECIKDGLNKTKEELYELGLNDSLNHVDFMIGTDDLNIKGIKNNKEYDIFINGKFVLKKD